LTYPFGTLHRSIITHAEVPMRCPDCNATLFHVKEEANGRQYLYCYRSKKCGWHVEIKPAVSFIGTGKS
jgi:uncharacterized protein with PIN domain